MRNVMADLEALGFVSSPHTSAGRVPTDKRLSLLRGLPAAAQPPPTDEVSLEAIHRQLDLPQESGKSLASTASQVLSRITHLAGVVTLPLAPVVVTDADRIPVSVREPRARGSGHERARSGESGHAARAGTTARRSCAAPPTFSMSNVPGCHWRRVRQKIVRQLQETHANMNQAMSDAIGVAQRVFAEQRPAADIEYVIAGETNLMGMGESSDVEKLKRLFEAFSEKRDILHLLDQSLQSRRGADLHRPGIGLPDPGRLQRGDGALQLRRGRGGGARGHWSDAHGL